MKYYVVWEGREPGVYDSWDECQQQVNGYPGARFKAFPSAEAAVAAYRGKPSDQLDIMRSILTHTSSPLMAKPAATYSPPVHPGIRLDAIAVDGACSVNPGPMEYRAVRVSTGEELFHIGDKAPLWGTNNIAEFLALIHIAALLKKNGDTTTPIYTDSKNALAWLRRGASRTTLAREPRTEATLELLRRADAWLAANKIANPILKWNTDKWGEIPADFGRK